MTPQDEFLEKREEAPTVAVSPAERLEYSQPYLRSLIRLTEAQTAFLAWKIDAEEFKRALEVANAHYVLWLDECRNKEKEKS
jgi:hypothetical protein